MMLLVLWLAVISKILLWASLHRRERTRTANTLLACYQKLLWTSQTWCIRYFHCSTIWATLRDVANQSPHIVYINFWNCFLPALPLARLWKLIICIPQISCIPIFGNGGTQSLHDYQTTAVAPACKGRFNGLSDCQNPHEPVTTLNSIPLWG